MTIFYGSLAHLASLSCRIDHTSGGLNSYSSDDDEATPAHCEKVLFHTPLQTVELCVAG